MNNNTTADLFSPIHMDSYFLRNRMVMAPMTRNRAGGGNVRQAMTAEYYRQRAGAGLNLPDQASFYGGDEHGYTDYPFMET